MRSSTYENCCTYGSSESKRGFGQDEKDVLKEISFTILPQIGMKEETKESPKKRAMVKLDDTVAMAEKYRKLAMKDIVENVVVNDNVLNFSTMTIMTRPD